MPTVSQTKFNDFVEQLALKKHDLLNDVIKVYLTNVAPVVTNTVYNTPADLTTGGGYTAGGADIQMGLSETGGVATLTAVDVVFTATTGFGAFRYAVVYNDTASPKGLISFMDYGSAISVGAGETFTVDFGASFGTLT